MKESIVQQLLDEIKPIRLYAPLETPEYRKASKQRYRARENLAKTLDHNGIALLTEYEENRLAVDALDLDDFFIKGFYLGAQLMLEILSAEF